MRDVRDSLAAALARLGAEAGADLSLNADGMVSIQLSDGVLCSIEMPEHATHFHLHAPVLTVAPHGGRGALEAAMARNLFGLGPPTAWLAWEADTRTVLLCAGVPAEGLSDERLRDLLADFHAEVVESRRALGHRAGELAAAASPPPDEGMVVLRI